MLLKLSLEAHLLKCLKTECLYLKLLTQKPQKPQAKGLMPECTN